METQKDFQEIYCEPSQEAIEKQQRAFNAMLAYERNCIQKYDRENLPSLPPKQGENMKDFAAKFDTTVEEMRRCEGEVEKCIETILQRRR